MDSRNNNTQDSHLSTILSYPQYLFEWLKYLLSSISNYITQEKAQAAHDALLEETPLTEMLAVIDTDKKSRTSWNYYNVVTYSENSKIKIKIEKIRLVDISTLEKNTQRHLSLKRLEPLNFKNNTYPLITDSEVKLEQINPIIFQAKELGFDSIHSKDLNQTYQSDAFIYEVPTNANEALNFIAILDLFTSRCSNVAINRNQSITHFIQFGQLSMPMLKFFDHSISIDDGTDTNTLLTLKKDFKASHTVIKTILKLADISSEYQPTIKALQKVYDYCLKDYIASRKTDPTTFYTCLADPSLRQLILADKSPYRLIDTTVPASDKLSILSLLKVNTIESINIIQKVNALAILELYNPCIGKQAADGGHYSSGYTELDMLRHAEFSLRSDGRISIINLDKNIGYTQHYALGRKNYAIFEEEMRFLGHLIGLTFAEDCNFHQEIIFTETCSNQLKSKGLHYNELYLKLYLLQHDSVKSNSSHLFFKDANSTKMSLQDNNTGIVAINNMTR